MLPLHDVVSLIASRFLCDTILTVMCRGKRIHISVHGKNLKTSQTLQQRFDHFLNAIEDQDMDDDMMEDFYDWLLKPCQKLLDDLCFPSHLTQPTYADWLALETLHFELHAIDDRLIPRRSAKDNIMMPPGIRLSSDLFSGWPVLRPGDLEIRLDSPGTAFKADSVEMSLLYEPRKMYVGDQAYFLKAARRNNQSQCERELKIFNEIARVGLKSLNITHLSAVVCDSDGEFYGLLFPYINGGGKTLTNAVSACATESVRVRWAEQVTHVVERLHAAGIVWGDVKPDNVLIDAEQNAWVVDFGGSYTEGWGQSETAETMEGDQIGLQKISDFIRSPTHSYMTEASDLLSHRPQLSD